MLAIGKVPAYIGEKKVVSECLGEIFYSLKRRYRAVVKNEAAVATGHFLGLFASVNLLYFPVESWVDIHSGTKSCAK